MPSIASLPRRAYQRSMIKDDNSQAVNQFGLLIQPDGQRIPVEFTLQGRDSKLTLHFPNRDFGEAFIDRLEVRQTSGRRLTFFGNLRTMATNHQGEGSLVTYLPSYIIVGRTDIGLEPEFDCISLCINDAKSIFYDFDSFSIYVGDDKEVINRII